MSFNVDEVLIMLAWESGVLDAETAHAALGITIEELIGWELAAIAEGCEIARDRIGPASAPAEIEPREERAA